MKRFNARKGSARAARTILFLGLVVWLLPVSSAMSLETIRVGIYDNPPKVFFTPSGLAAGLYPDILNAIARERGWALEWVPGTWQECLDRLKTGKINLMVDIARIEERLSDLRFSREPVLTNWGAVYTRKAISIQAFKDLRNRSVAVVKGSAHTEGIRGFRHLMAQFGIPCRYVEVDSPRKAMMLLDSSQVDVAVVNRLFGALYGAGFDVVPTPLIFSPKVLFFAAPINGKNAEHMLDQIDESLKRFKKDPDSVFYKAMGYYLSGGRNTLRDIHADYLQSIDLTEKKRQWIASHRVVRFAVDPHFTPFEFVSPNGQFRGMAADYLDLIHQKTGLTFRRVAFDTWDEGVQAAREGRVDLLPCLADTPARRRFLDFSTPYIQFSRVIITAMDSPLKRLNGLQGLKTLRVGVQRQSSHHEFLNAHPGIAPMLFETFEDAVMALSRGKIDAVIGNLAVAQHTIKQLSLTNLKFAGYAAPEPQSLSMGVRKDWPELTAILDKALASVSFREKNRILSQWFPLPTEAHNNIGLTREEREWLLLNPRIRVAWDRHWAPVEFADENGAPRGVSMEYLAAMEKLLGVEFDMGHDLGWEAMEKAVEDRQIDMFSCVAITPRRLAHLEFTDTYLSLPAVIFAREGMAYVRDLSELAGKRVAVVAGYAVDQWLSRDHPGLSVQRVHTVADGFNRLRKSRVDAFICNVLPGNYYLSRLKRHDIKIAGEAPYKLKLRMAVRNDWPILARILQKTLKALPEAEKTYFYRKWALVKYEKGFDYGLFKKIMGFVLLLVIAIIFWNTYMAAEIARRKKVEARLASNEKQLQKTNEDLREMEALKDNLAHMIVHDMRSPLAGISGYLELLEHRLKDRGSDQSLDEYLHLSRNGVTTLSRMMQSLLDIFKLESDELPLDLETRDLKETAATVVEDMQGMARLYGIELVLSGTACKGRFDGELIRRVLTNLVENGLKASPAGSRVEIHLRCDHTHVIAEVKDCGYGIPASFQDKIFDKFSKLESESGGPQQSYGLGLAFCKLAVEAHGGTIKVDSQEGKGSTFSFTLPRAG
jgi:ABC-type amino acid transport substrate-binding protein/nitrogen-specific signal transduction histidine kinase